MVSNYHPISLLCIASKVLEKIIYKHTINFFSDLFTNHQFGFIPDCFSLQQLLLFVKELITAKENSYEVDTIYVDFNKAFNTVPHTTLLTKLRKYGITGGVFNFYQAYLSNRLQCVNINGLTFYLSCQVFPREVYWGLFSLLYILMTYQIYLSKYYTLYLCRRY